MLCRKSCSIFGYILGCDYLGQFLTGQIESKIQAMIERQLFDVYAFYCASEVYHLA